MNEFVAQMGLHIHIHLLCETAHIYYYHVWIMYILVRQSGRGRRNAMAYESFTGEGSPELNRNNRGEPFFLSFSSF